MERCVLTGGAGFIGSHLADLLIKKGHEVIVIDNMVTGRPENIKQHINNNNFILHPLDITDFRKRFQMVKEIFSGADWVFHLAALADIVPSIENPVKYHKANVDGTINMLDCAKETHVKKFIYMASSSCYGIPDIYPTPETAPIQPMYPYALTKYLGEYISLHYHKVYNLPVNSIRCFNVYGPRARTSGAYGAVFGVFLAQKLHNKPFTVIGDGNQTRDFTYVTDVTEALYETAKSKFAGEIINIGSGETHSVNEIVELLGGDKIHIPKRPGEPDITHADITKAKRFLNYKPKVSFEEGIKQLLKNTNHWKNAPIWTPKTIAKATRSWYKYIKD